jgi:hypothetical protein
MREAMLSARRRNAIGLARLKRDRPRLEIVSKAKKPGLTLHSPSEDKMRAAFDSYVGTLRDAARQMSADELTENVNNLPWNEAEQALLDDWEAMVEGAAEKGYKDGKEKVKFPTDEDRRAMVFSLDNPYATAWTREHGSEMIQGISNGTRDGVRQIIRSGFTENKTPGQIAREIRGYKPRVGPEVPGLVGLLPRDDEAVSRYRAQLEEVQGLSPEQAARSASRYAQRLLNRRGETIARTEVAQAQVMGTLNAWSDAKDQGFVSPRTRKRWITAWDERTCEYCAPMHNELVKPGEAFDTGLGSVQGPPLHPNCHCDVVLFTPSAGRELPKRPSREMRQAQAKKRAENLRSQAKRRRDARKRQYRGGKLPKPRPPTRDKPERKPHLRQARTGRKLTLNEEQQRAQQNSAWLRKTDDPSAASYKERRDHYMWSWVHGSKTKAAVTMKKAAIEEFGLKGIPYSRRDYKVSPKWQKTAKEDMRRMYDDTQREFARRDVKTVTLYRGVKSDVETRGALESWTTDPKIADKFDGHGVIKMEVPVEQVLTSHQSPGWVDGVWGNQKEYVVMF